MPSYPPSKRFGNRCGRSWNEEIYVYGDVLWRQLPPLTGALPQFGYNSAAEVGLRDALRAHVAESRQWLVDLKLEGAVTDKEADEFTFLHNGVIEYLDQIPPIYEKWDTFQCIRGIGETPTVCPWPLDRSDDPADWMPGCTGSNFEGIASFHQDQYGRTYQCPVPAVVAERPKDRNRIRNLVISGLRWMRCAQYWMHVASLKHQERLEKVVDPTATFGPGGDGPEEPETSGLGVGGLGTEFDDDDRDIPPPIEPEPLDATAFVDFEYTLPGETPGGGMDSEIPPGDGPDPDGETDDSDGTEGEGAPPEQQETKSNSMLWAAGAVALGLLVYTQTKK